MQWLNKSMKVVILFSTVIISSCGIPKQDTSWLVGRIYVNEETLDKIEFIGKERCIFTLGSPRGYLVKGRPLKCYYKVYKNNEFYPFGFASAEVAYCPYEMLKFSDSKEEIFFSEIGSNKSGVFKRNK